MNDSTLAVDILINNYNYAAFVGDAVESALAQTYTPLNVIVVDDGSTDQSREILEAYKKRIDLLLKDNGGQASALNAGFARSSADIVIFLDADDLLKPGAAASAARAFAACPEAAKVQYRMEVIDELGRPRGSTRPPLHVPLPQGDVRRAELVFPFDLAWAATSGNAFRADLVRRIMPIPELEFAACPDWYLVHLTALLGSVVSLDEVAASYRVHAYNSYAARGSRLDLAHVRQAVRYASATRRALQELADELGLTRPHDEILSVADLSNRLVSLKLEPDKHPNREDRAWRLARDGIRAAARRFDVPLSMKALFTGWFIAMAGAPSPLARPLAEIFLIRERRPFINRLVRHLQRGKRTVQASDA